jgi:GAF domain-containing protein
MTPENGGSAAERSRPERDVLVESLRELYELLLVEESLDDTVERIAHLTCRTIEGCAHGSVTRPGKHGAYTAVSTSTTAFEIDTAQYNADTGPCLDAMHETRVVRVAPMSGSGAYEQFRAAAVERGVGSSLSLPLSVRGQSVGALNLYSEADHGFDTVADDLGITFASQVAVAISAATLHERTRGLVIGLEDALVSRDQIGQAKGILMATHRITGDEAFARLVRASQNTNRKLRDIADEVVATGALPDN